MAQLYNSSQQSIVLNWCFIKSTFHKHNTRKKKCLILTRDLLPTCINFELGSHFSTTWNSRDDKPSQKPNLLTKGGVICQQCEKTIGQPQVPCASQLQKLELDFCQDGEHLMVARDTDDIVVFVDVALPPWKRKSCPKKT